MAPWQAELFISGAGCPCCEGDEPADTTDEIRQARFERFGRDLLTCGYDDFGHTAALERMEIGAKPWVRPVDPVLFKCPRCDAELRRDLDSGEPDESDSRYWRGGDPGTDRYYRGAEGDAPLDDPETVTIAGEVYCPACVTQCDECGVNVFRDGETGDVYDPGASFPSPFRYFETVCVDCLESEATCAGCGQPQGATYDNADLDENGLCEDCAPESGEGDQ
jgi:hypothetical protein